MTKSKPPGRFVNVSVTCFRSDADKYREALAKQLEGASLDELRVVAFVVERLCMLGRVAYGPLDLATDERDFGIELDEEIVDALVYVACARLKSSAGKTG